jgi:hypothetical protein
MRRFLSATALGVATCLSSPAGADAPLVRCECTQGGWCGPGHYAYDVDAASYPMMEFVVGTNDLERGNYFNVAVPPGWDFAVDDQGMGHACGLFAFHGELSDGPCYGITPGRLRWWTDDPAFAVEFFTFSYDHVPPDQPWLAEDVSFALTTRREGEPPQYDTFTESWYEQVGMGFGPLHAPWGPTDWCWSDEECGEDGRCFFDGCAAETGVCVPRPYNCPWLWDPVCGCDGQTYANACIAALYGVRLAYHDECLVGDLDLDGDVDLWDLDALLSGYGACVGDPGYCERADLDNSGCIDLPDLATLLAHYGEGCA